MPLIRFDIPRVRLWVGELIMEDAKNYHLYIVTCSDGTLYTGISLDVTKRVALHNLGRGAKYTRSRLPVELVYQEIYTSKGEALSREYQVKKMTRSQKLALIDHIATSSSAK